MFKPLKNKQELLLKTAGLMLGAAGLLALCLGLIFNSAQLHYGNLRLGTELTRLRQEPLLKKYPAEPAPLEYAGLEVIRGLAESQGLEFISSQSGGTELEIILQGGYKNFLDYLRALAAEQIGEISQLDLTPRGRLLESRLILKQGDKK
ncbi:MAG: hypothetical protein LBQ83_04015 [Candidatus Margulisbacteria bacterium]|jgi:hypothetical protein|nr:hypothetical protein [Candidatus Margulisiibacteriota bacterium]